MNIAYLLLGSNEGNRVEILTAARKAIVAQIGAITATSPLYESEAWGFVSDNFINQVLCVATELLPLQVLAEINTIEAEAGRIRHSTGNYEPRLLDIDILFYNNWIVSNNRLTIPHPRLHERRFTLLPLNDIAPDLQHPVLRLSSKQLLQQCTDEAKVWVYNGSVLKVGWRDFFRRKV